MILLNNCVSDTIGYLQSINENFEAIKSIVDVSNDSISNEIDAVNTLLVVFSIVFALVGVVLGVYISFLHNKVIKIKESIDDKEQTIIRIAKTVEETDSKITNDLRGLYEKLQKEETLSLLRRLDEEPQDISNLIQPLLARSLEEDGFAILKQAFLKLKSMDLEDYDYSSKVSSFTLLFFQHYLYQSLLSDELRDDVISNINQSVQCAFKRDIIKSTKDMCKAISIDSAPFNKIDILVSYLKAINDSRFKDSVELKNILLENLNSNLRVEAIDRCTTDKCYLSMFGVYEPVDTPMEEENDYKEDE
jgi:hypothetical protein